MCLTGSCATILFLVLCKIFSYRFSPVSRFIYLIVNTFLYLFPLPLFKVPIYSLIIRFVNLFDPDFSISPFFQNGIWRADNSKIIWVYNGLHYLPKYSKLFWLFFFIWIIIGTIFLCIQIIKYRQFRRFILNISVEAPLNVDLNECRLFRRKHAEFAVPVRILEGNETPFTIGYFKPIIFIRRDFPINSSKLAIQHELNHIIHGDIFYKTIGVVVLALHWYSPVSTFLYFKSLCNTLELLCDKKVLANKTDQTVNDYVNLLLNEMSSKKSLFVNTFHSAGYRFAKERILMIKKTHYKTSIFIAIPVLICLLLSALPVTAYEPQVVLDWDMFSTSADEAAYGPANTDYDSTLLVFSDSDVSSLEFISEDIWEQDIFFADHTEYYLMEDGKIIFPTDIDPALSYDCQHIWENASLRRHIPNSDGSCYVDTYNVRICNICNTVSSQSLVSSTFYPTCIH